MDLVLDAKDVVGFHPDSYGIDITASSMNGYTKWDMRGNHWCNPKPVCFDSLLQYGWIAKDKFDWNQVNTLVEWI